MKQIFFILSLMISLLSYGQEFIFFEDRIEYEGQKFLMDEIYEISSSDIARMRIDKTIRERDTHEGFDFAIASYSFKGKNGVVFTSFNKAYSTLYYFVNIHLSHEEFIALNDELELMARNDFEIDEHLLKRFNDRLILDINKNTESINFTIWVDTDNRHTITLEKWRRAMKGYNKFRENQ